MTFCGQSEQIKWPDPAIHWLSGGVMPDRAENDSAIVRAIARVVPLRTVNERLNEAFPVQSQLSSIHTQIARLIIARTMASGTINGTMECISLEIRESAFSRLMQ
jgi:hypothetical protein